MTNRKSFYSQQVVLYPSLFFIQQLCTNHTTLFKCPRFALQTNNFDRYLPATQMLAPSSTSHTACGARGCCDVERRVCELGCNVT